MFCIKVVDPWGTMVSSNGTSGQKRMGKRIVGEDTEGRNSFFIIQYFKMSETI